MTLPSTIALWASATNYATGGPTKSALPSGRLAEGYKPLAHGVAAQEANEYLHRLGEKSNEHRAWFIDVADRVPGLDDVVTLDSPVIGVGGTYTHEVHTDVPSSRITWGWKILAGDTARFVLAVPPGAQWVSTTMHVLGIGAPTAPPFQGEIFYGYKQVSTAGLCLGSANAAWPVPGTTGWNQIQAHTATPSTPQTTSLLTLLAGVQAFSDLMVIGFQSTFSE